MFPQSQIGEGLAIAQERKNLDLLMNTKSDSTDVPRHVLQPGTTMNLIEHEIGSLKEK